MNMIFFFFLNHQTELRNKVNAEVNNEQKEILTNLEEKNRFLYYIHTPPLLLFSFTNFNFLHVLPFILQRDTQRDTRQEGYDILIIFWWDKNLQVS